MDDKDKNQNGATTPIDPQIPPVTPEVPKPEIVPAIPAPVPPAPEVPQPSVPDLLKTIKELTDRLEIVESASDRGRMEGILSRRRKAPTPVVLVSYFDDKPVMAWEMVLDEVYQDSGGTWNEKQVVEIHMQDGSAKKLSYIDFQRLLKKKQAEIVTRTPKEEEDVETGVVFRTETFTVKVLETSEVLELSGSFIN